MRLATNRAFGRWSGIIEWAGRIVRPSEHRRYMARKHAGNLFGWLFRYTVLIGMSFILLYPVLFIVAAMFKTGQDAVDASVHWVPKHWSLKNVDMVIQFGQYWANLRLTATISILPAILQCLACGVAGYGFARPGLPGLKWLTVLLMATFIMPAQAVAVPLYRMYGGYHWLGTLTPFLAPEALGHGIRGALFVLMFRQYFKGVPWQLEEAAAIDGANPLRIFARIMYPMAKPIILVVFVFSLVWHWNETFLTGLFFMMQPQAGLGSMLRFLGTTGITSGTYVTQEATLPYVATGAVMVMVPMLLFYSVAQRYFTEGVERTGLTAE